MRLATAVAALGATMTSASAASANEPRGLDWGRAIVELDRFARAGSERPSAHGAPGANMRAGLDDPNPQSMGNAWFGVAPSVTLVARDWASSTRLAGDRLSVVDGMRLSASTRMVVARVRLSNTRFTPFVQTGVGQWRVDRNYLPLTPASIEVAGQLGTGFELHLTRSWELAAEATATSLIREKYAPGVPELLLWSASIASRVEF